MKKVYLNLPTLAELRELLEATFPVSETLTVADIVITEGELEFITNKLVISVGDKRDDSRVVRISRNLSTEAIYQAVKAAADTYRITACAPAANASYHVLKDSNPKVGYLVKKLENILNASSESIVEIDFDGSILFHNKKFAEVYGCPGTVIEGNIQAIFDTGTASDVHKAMVFSHAEESNPFSGRMKKHGGTMIPIEGRISPIPGDTSHYEITFEDVTEKIKDRQKAKKIEEQAIIAGFSRHLSHNVMNALTTAGGFIKRIKSKSSDDSYLSNLWRIVDDKLLLIEEIVAGYNDYTHAITLKKKSPTELASFYKDLVESVALKKLERNFSAYLYKFYDGYTVSYDFSNASEFETEANGMFLKLAFCYIIKDNIRYFGGRLPLKYSVSLHTEGDEFTVKIAVPGIELPEDIVETMFKPWNHQVLTQSYDYWGVVIANAVMENHNGFVKTVKKDDVLEFLLTVRKDSGGK